jgi:hypothetical protein
LVRGELLVDVDGKAGGVAFRQKGQIVGKFGATVDTSESVPLAAEAGQVGLPVVLAATV